MPARSMCATHCKYCHFQQSAWAWLSGYLHHALQLLGWHGYKRLCPAPLIHPLFQGWKLVLMRELYIRILMRSLCSRGFSTCPIWYLFSMVVRGLRSVTTSNWVRPFKKIQHFRIAQAIPSISISAVHSYFLSEKEIRHEPCTTNCCCFRTNPKPCNQLASTCKEVMRFGS